LPPSDDPRDIAQLGERMAQLLAQQQALVKHLSQGRQDFQRLARSVWRVQEDERRRFARELHDGLGQNLTALVRLLDQSLEDLPHEQRQRLAGARALAETTLQDTRALSRLMRPQILDDLGLEAALRWLARTLGDSHGLKVDISIDPALPPFDGDHAILIFRIVQEALNNTAKHARATQAQVRLQALAQRALLRVEDDGAGCDPARALEAGSESHGSGLGGMRDRVRLFDGDLRVDSSPGGGFRLQVEFPLAPTGGRMGP
jgi:signal transduction histidine kinase